MPALVRFHNDNFDTTLEVGHFFSYEFHDVWGGTYDQCQKKMEEFFASQHFKDIQPIPGALDALHQLKEVYDLQIVTSRQFFLEDCTRQWILEHFPDIFSEVHFGNHYATEGKKRSKLEICRAIGAFLLIDDSAKYAKECAEGGLPVVLFGDYAWNAALVLSTDPAPAPEASSSSSSASPQEQAAALHHAYIRRAGSWADVVSIITANDANFLRL